MTRLRSALWLPIFDDLAEPAPGADPTPYAKVGATWWLVEFSPETMSLDQVRGILRDGPAEIAIERIR